MPTVLLIGNYRFHFYSDERHEPPHIHVATTGGECKFWLEPIRLAKNKGVTQHRHFGVRLANLHLSFEEPF